MPIVGLTAYDTPMALLVDASGVDLILVGDSLGRLVLGYERIETTTMEDMIHHCAAVRRGVQHAFLVGDLPFGAYESGPSTAFVNAIRLMKEGGVDAVKLEGGFEVVPTVRALAAARIPVVGHLTATHIPETAQSDDMRAQVIGEMAAALEEAGVAALVLVDLDPSLAKAATDALHRIPSIGYRSGASCDGQLLITPYMLGLLPARTPAPGPYGAFGNEFARVFAQYREDVRSGVARIERTLDAEDRAHR